MDSEMLRQIYVPKWNMVNESALNDPDVCRSLVDQLALHVLFSQLRGMNYDQLFTEFNDGAARQTCLGAEVRMRTEHILREKKKLKGRCSRQTDLLKEMDVEITSLRAQLTLKEAGAAEAIRLCGQVSIAEAMEATRVAELNSFKERTTALEGQVAALEFAGAIKDTELAASLESKKDKLIDQVSMLDTTCCGLRDQVSGYELFKEQYEAVQDEQVNVLSDKVAGIDADLVEMALHLDEEFYPCFLTTIAGRRWILRRGLRLIVMKCLQSSEYLAAFGGAIGRAIDKGMQDGLVAGIDHGKVGRGLAEVAAYNTSAKSNYVFVVNALCAVDFPLLAQLMSQKDPSIADIMGLFYLEGPAAEALEANQLQSSPEQLMLPIHRPQDQVVIGETSLPFSLDVVHARVQRIRGDVASQRVSISDFMVPLIEPLSAENLVGEASTSGVPAAVIATTALLTTFVQANFVPPVPASDYEVADIEPHAEASSSQKEELKTTPEHPETS
ncbi:hypothetical protein Tco_1203360 [Tanacetum coccineum]